SSLSRKLLGLGLRVGTEVCVLQQRRRGVVVASAGCLVALGSTIANKLRIQPLRARERIIS
ncbi:MAG: ferrous iron transport protein A, partial [Anaerolineae bacterium]|nr:ferrous iron transport protein A [Anaerolineae bacterium]